MAPQLQSGIMVLGSMGKTHSIMPSLNSENHKITHLVSFLKWKIIYHEQLCLEALSRTFYGLWQKASHVASSEAASGHLCRNTKLNMFLKCPFYHYRAQFFKVLHHPRVISCLIFKKIHTEYTEYHLLIFNDWIMLEPGTMRCGTNTPGAGLSLRNTPQDIHDLFLLNAL